MHPFLAACRKQPTPYTPIWLMRQAGRYQAEYRAIREKVSFLELCKTPELATEVTVFAVKQLNVDAAIIFADILLILEPLGAPFSFSKDDGPVIHTPIRSSAQIDALAEDVTPEESLDFVLKAIQMTRRELGDTPLIGFAGAPFTLASYLIEGGGSKNYLETKRLMFSDEGAWRTLMTKLTTATVTYLNAQVKAGAQVLQVFDSWAGCLNPTDYQRYVLPFMQRLFAALDPSVQVIHFCHGNPALLQLAKAGGGNVIAVDTRTDLDTAWNVLNHGTRDDVAIMGNLDPISLFAPTSVIRERADDILRQVGKRPGHIFNLGHGILPKTPVDHVRFLVDHVHSASAR